MDGGYWIPVGLGILAAFVLYLSVMATVALYRATTLTRPQKVAQILIAWLIPIIGARLVMHFLVEQDREAIPKEFFPNETIDRHLKVALGIPARESLKFTQAVIEQKVYEAVSHHFSSDNSEASSPASGGGGDGGGSQ